MKEEDTGFKLQSPGLFKNKYIEKKMSRKKRLVGHTEF